MLASTVTKSAPLPPGPWHVEAQPSTIAILWHDPSTGAVHVTMESPNTSMSAWTTRVGVEALRDACNALLAEADSPVPDSDPVRALAADDARGEVDR